MLVNFVYHGPGTLDNGESSPGFRRYPLRRKSPTHNDNMMGQSPREKRLEWMEKDRNIYGLKRTKVTSLEDLWFYAGT